MKKAIFILLFFPIFFSFSQTLTDSTVYIYVKIKKDPYGAVESFEVLRYSSPEIDSIVKKILSHESIPYTISGVKNGGKISIPIHRRYLINAQIKPSPKK